MYYYNDDEVLQEVEREAKRRRYLKDTLVQASRRRDVENVESILRQILAEINRRVDNLRALAYKAIEWFKNL